jgi:hypothetical protein
MKRERKDQSEMLHFAQNDRVFMVPGCPSAKGMSGCSIGGPLTAPQARRRHGSGQRSLRGAQRRRQAAALQGAAAESESLPQSVDKDGEDSGGAWPCPSTPHATPPERCRGRACPTLVAGSRNAGTASRPPTAGPLSTDWNPCPSNCARRRPGVSYGSRAVKS